MNRNGLMRHVGDWITRLGSQNRVAEKCGISGTAMSQWMNGKYGADTTELDKKIASALGYQEDGWQVVTTIKNYQKIEFVFRSCKQQAMWMAISNKAGSGKTQTLEHLFNSDLTGSVIFIQAEEWNSRQFLLELAERTCGVPKRGYTDIPTLLRMIAEYLNGMAASKPILIVDEADKLKPAAFRKLIPLYNRTEHRLGAYWPARRTFIRRSPAAYAITRRGTTRSTAGWGDHTSSFPARLMPMSRRYAWRTGWMKTWPTEYGAR